jgi:hypothetical protein
MRRHVRSYGATLLQLVVCVSTVASQCVVQFDVWEYNNFCDGGGFAFQFDLGDPTPVTGAESCVIQREMNGEAHWSDQWGWWAQLQEAGPAQLRMQLYENQENCENGTPWVNSNGGPIFTFDPSADEATNTACQDFNPSSGKFRILDGCDASALLSSPEVPGCSGDQLSCSTSAGVTHQQAVCVYGDHCMCTDGFVCSDTMSPGECAVGSAGTVFCIPQPPEPEPEPEPEPLEPEPEPEPELELMYTVEPPSASSVAASHFTCVALYCTACLLALV